MNQGQEADSYHASGIGGRWLYLSSLSPGEIEHHRQVPTTKEWFPGRNVSEYGANRERHNKKLEHYNLGGRREGIRQLCIRGRRQIGNCATRVGGRQLLCIKGRRQTATMHQGQEADVNFCSYSQFSNQLKACFNQTFYYFFILKMFHLTHMNSS